MTIKLTDTQRATLAQLPADGSWGRPLSTTHNGTLASLLRKDLIKWSHGPYMGQSVWRLSYGNFRLTETGQEAASHAE